MSVCFIPPHHSVRCYVLVKGSFVLSRGTGLLFSTPSVFMKEKHSSRIIIIYYFEAKLYNHSQYLIFEFFYFFLVACRTLLLA